MFCGNCLLGDDIRFYVKDRGEIRILNKNSPYDKQETWIEVVGNAILIYMYNEFAPQTGDKGITPYDLLATISLSTLVLVYKKRKTYN